MKKYYFLLGSSAVVLGFGLCLSLMTSCEGPEGLAGKDGKDGQDANETCKICHSPSVVDAVSVQYELSKHSYGEAAFEEAGSTTCGPCHLSEAFKYVVKNNTPTTFVLNTATPPKYVNQYFVASNAAYGEISCFTCHSSLHSTYDSTDFSPLTTTAAVTMTMWKGAKTIDLTQDDGSSNLCVKCHQPRPFVTSTTLSDGDVVNYAALVSSPNSIFYDSTVNATTNKLVPGYRTHTHYGTVGAIYAGKGGIEFSGTATYSNSPHTTVASCQDCHMAPMTLAAGGHSFRVRSGEGALSATQTNWNFNGCNVSGCHSASPISKTSTTKWTTPRTSVQTLLNNLAVKLHQDGINIINKNGDGETNLWAGLTSGNYDGYLNVYDPVTNPDGAKYNTKSFRNPSPSSSWTQEQKDLNKTFPKLTLKNVQFGALINFQLCLREYSLGIHNTAYTSALLQNTIDALTLAGY